MASVIKDALDYLAGQTANLTRQDSTAGGNTDDKEPDKPGQAEQIGAGSTDARSIANVIFGKADVRIPATILAAGDMYDVTQGCTRLNKLYGMVRDNFYEQASGAVGTRKNRLAMKQQLIADCFRQAEKPKEAVTRKKQ
jgi:hypothetical protein